MATPHDDHLFALGAAFGAELALGKQALAHFCDSLFCAYAIGGDQLGVECLVAQVREHLATPCSEDARFGEELTGGLG